MGSTADFSLIKLLQTLPAAERWQRFPMSNDAAALHALADASAGAAIVWAPSFWAARKAEPDLARLHVVTPRPLPASPMEVGAVLLAKETFLRSGLDKAIASLSEDGTIEGILKAQGFPARAVP
jgi:polar amino acid transport system substrate-binding protein